MIFCRVLPTWFWIRMSPSTKSIPRIFAKTTPRVDLPAPGMPMSTMLLFFAIRFPFQISFSHLGNYIKPSGANPYAS